MNLPVSSSYQMGYVLLSYLVSVVGAFVALSAATRIRRRDGGINLGNTMAAGLALGGIGVWSMHFIGMVALKLEVASSYALLETGVSLVAAVVGTALALGYVARNPKQLGRLAGAGFVLGMGVVVMHYLGMYGMKIGGYIRWDYGIVGISAVIAVVAATAALWLAFNTGGWAPRSAAALLMGGAVCAMHYTGMHAAEFICTTDQPQVAPRGFGLVTMDDVPSAVAFVALLLSAVISIYLVCQESTEIFDDMEPARR